MPGPERPEPVPERPEPGRVPVPAPGPAVPAAGRTRPAGGWTVPGSGGRGPLVSPLVGAAGPATRSWARPGVVVIRGCCSGTARSMKVATVWPAVGSSGAGAGATGVPPVSASPTSTARSARVALSRGGSGAAAGASAGAGATWAAGLGVGTCAGAGAAVSNRCGCPAYVLDPSTWIRSGITYPIRSSRTVARTGCPAARVRRCRWFRTASWTDSPVPATTGMPPTVAPPPGPRSGSRCAGTGTRTSIGVTVAPVRAVDTAPAAERLRLCSRWSRDIVPHSGRSARARWAGGGLPGTVRSLGRKIPVRVRC